MEVATTAKPWYVYCLQCEDGNTYIGATVDVNRRLRQHNKELTGGARRTTAKASVGLKWQRILYVSGFSDSRHALQFEWRWKFISRKLTGGNALERRIRALPDTIQKHPGPNLTIHVEPACAGEHILALQVCAPVVPSQTDTA
jgi:predicted GIY-YIG superfamily endonuclease